MAKIFPLLLVVAALWVCSSGWADSDSGPPAGQVPDQPIPSLLEQPEFGGIDPKDADQFWLKWHLVTTRFRKDNGQMRFVYANDLAWGAMMNRSQEYPKGSMLAKISFMPRPDPTFPSSLVPKKFLRIQLMKKDAQAFADTKGWSYAIYGAANAKLSKQENEKKEIVACFACHQIVAKKDYVFSEPVFLQWDLHHAAAQESLFENKFVATDISSLPHFARRAADALKVSLPPKIKLYSMPLFPGSLGESIGTLAQFSENDLAPHLLVDEESKLFLITAPPAAGVGGCVQSVRFLFTVGTGKSSALRGGRVCDGKIVWEEKTPFSPAD